MLSKDFKVDKKLISLVLKQGKIFNSPYFTLRVFKQKTDCKKFGLFSFVVSKKVAKNSTDRNKLKRKGLYIIRKIIHTFHCWITNTRFNSNYPVIITCPSIIEQSHIYH